MAQAVNPYESPRSHLSPERTDESNDAECHPFRSARGWGLMAVVGLAFCLALAGLALWQVGTIVGAPATGKEAQLLKRIDALKAFIFIGRLLTAVPFLTWMYRAYRNLRILGHDNLESKLSWVVLCWFIPFMNWFCPYLVMVELYRRSRPSFDPAVPRQPAAALVKGWWGAFVVSLLSLWAQGILDDAWTTFWLDANYLLFTMVSAGLAIGLILEIDASQMERFSGLMRLDPAGKHAAAAQI
jgi:hypothetical protein